MSAKLRHVLVSLISLNSFISQANGQSVTKTLDFFECPKQLEVRAGGLWGKGRYSDEIRSALQNNPSRKAKVFGAMYLPESEASFSVMGLSTLSPIQGKMTPEMFGKMRLAFSRSIPDSLPPSVLERVEQFNATHRDSAITDFQFFKKMDSGENYFTIFSLTDSTIEGRRTLFLSASKHVLVEQCAINVIVGLPAQNFGLRELFSATNDISITAFDP